MDALYTSQEVKISTGSAQLDDLLHWLRPGDNVVWQIETVSDYARFASVFAAHTIASGKKSIYIRFSEDPPVLEAQPGLLVICVDPSPGFDHFSRTVHEIIESNGSNAYYIFDNLTYLVGTWATDELLADFYQVTCPFVYELGSVAYFAITRDVHDYATIARIKTTTQILISIYHAGDNTYIHPLKVWQRYSPNMFLTHLVQKDHWTPVSTSIDAAAVLSAAGKQLVHTLPDSDSPWNTMFKKLLHYHHEGTASPGRSSEMEALQTELTRMMFGNHERLNHLADKYLTADDIIGIRGRLIGSGRIGGKAAGMLLARKVLESADCETDYSAILEKHDSFYIGSDAFFSFLVNNNLFRLRLKLARDPEMQPDEFSQIEKAFLDGRFPRETIEQFRDMLEHYGQAPIIVRSSSLLEDGFTHAYAGKYRSEFCANQGTPDERLENFLRAVKLVYASALNPDVISYRRRMGLTEGDEQMAILVQRVSGMPFEKYFFPTLAGVAFSRNLYAWNERIDPEKGMVRVVFGLGTRAVNRVGGDYPRMIALSQPLLRPEPVSQICSYSQKNIDLIDISSNEFSTSNVHTVLDGRIYPGLHLLASSLAEGFEQELSYKEQWHRNCALTLQGLIRRTRFVAIMDEALTVLEKAWGQPVDIEFTAHIDQHNSVTLNLLQCRSLRLPRLSAASTSSAREINQADILFKSSRAIGAGAINDIRYIVFVDPGEYSAINSVDMRRSLGRVIGKLNSVLAQNRGKIILMGPGRWGSSNIALGINVTFADISGVSVLVEIACPESGYDPEVSYGTHFFLDLVEADIIYVPLYPDEAGACFNAGFFKDRAVKPSQLLPGYQEFDHIIYILDVTQIFNGASASLIVDPQQKTAVCLIDRHLQQQK